MNSCPRISLFLIIILSFTCIGYYPLAEEIVSQPGQGPSSKSATPVTPVGMDGKLSLDLRSTEMIDALNFLAMKAGINIIATKNVAGRVTLMVENVPVQDVFNIMLRSNGLAYTKQGEIYNIMTEEEYKALFGKKFSDIRQVRVFRLKYAIPEQAFSLLDAMKSEVGRVLVEPDSGTVLIMDTPENIKKAEEALATLEQKNLVQVFNLKYGKAKEIEEQLKTHLNDKKVGSAKAYDRSNQIVVQTLPDRMQDIEKLITAMDNKPREVLIDTKIVKVKLSDQLDSGIQWEGLVNIGERFGMTYIGSYPFSAIQAASDVWRPRTKVVDDLRNAAGQINVGSYPFSGTTSNQVGSKVSPTEEMHVGLINRKRDIDTVVKYLQTLGNTQILSSPKLAVVDNQEAKIHVGEKQAYVTTTTTTGQTTTTVSEQVTFVDVGIQLAVTPTINEDGFVMMKIKPEVSSVVSTLTTPSGNKIPIIDTSLAETTVLVKDGATIIIGGLRKEEKSSSYDQVPILGNLPLIGFLFKSGTKKTERTELLVMLTPHIVEGDELVTGDDRERAFGDNPSKETKNYGYITPEPDIALPQEEPEGRIKPYREYISSARPEETPPPSIKETERKTGDE